MRSTLGWACLIAVCLPVLAAGRALAAAAGDLPRPGIGVFFKAEDAAHLREKIQRPPCRELYERMLKQADAAMAKWPDDKAQLRLSELAPKLADLTMEQVPAEFAPEGAKQAGVALEKYATEGAPCAAVVYLMTGDRRYAAFAWEVFGECAKANRWGWFPWAGSHVPQITSAS